MNYFGLFFSFMLPGIFLGGMAVVVLLQELTRRKRRAEREERARRLKNARRLYVHAFEAVKGRAA